MYLTYFLCLGFVSSSNFNISNFWCLFFPRNNRANYVLHFSFQCCFFLFLFYFFNEPSATLSFMAITYSTIAIDDSKFLRIPPASGSLSSNHNLGPGQGLASCCHAFLLLRFCPLSNIHPHSHSYPQLALTNFPGRKFSTLKHILRSLSPLPSPSSKFKHPTRTVPLLQPSLQADQDTHTDRPLQT